MKSSANQKAVKRVCGKCAGIHKKIRENALLEPMSWRWISNQMTAFNESKQSLKKAIKSAFLSIIISCFHFFPAFFNLINLFINFFKAAKRILINYFIKAMKEKMKLESRPDTLIHAISYRAIWTRGKRSEASRQAGLAVPLSTLRGIEFFQKKSNNFPDIYFSGSLGIMRG